MTDVETTHVATDEAHKPKPFVKWVGGKRQLFTRILPHLLELAHRSRAQGTLPRYFEPFVGGGAVMFGLAQHYIGTTFTSAVIGDMNEELMNAYHVVKRRIDETPGRTPDDVGALISDLRGFENAFHASAAPSSIYYAMREVDPSTLTDVGRATRFIALNKTCFNGLYRVNRKGQFNVPYGKRPGVTICDTDTLRADHYALARVDIRVGPYSMTCTDAQAGDVIYFDPPYVPVSPTASFTSYTEEGFNYEAQARLAVYAANLVRNGVRVVLSNSDTDLSRGLYSDADLFEIYDVSARRALNCDGAKRGAVGEILVVSKL